MDQTICAELMLEDPLFEPPPEFWEEEQGPGPPKPSGVQSVIMGINIVGRKIMEIAAVVLAAGRGKRMAGPELVRGELVEPVERGSENGSEIPKVMFKANGKPVVSYLIQSLRDADLKKILLVVGYKREIVRGYFRGDVEYAVQKEQLGTGHATLSAKENLADKSDAVLVCYGDMPLYKSETIKKLIQYFKKDKPTVAMLTVDFSDPKFWAYGRIIRNSSGEIDAIVEQKDCTPEQLKIKECNPGFYIFDAAWLWENLEKIKTDNAQGEYYLTDTIALAKDQGKKIGTVKVQDESEVLGINTPEQLKQVEEVLEMRNEQ